MRSSDGRAAFRSQKRYQKSGEYDRRVENVGDNELLDFTGVHSYYEYATQAY